MKRNALLLTSMLGVLLVFGGNIHAQVGINCDVILAQVVDDICHQPPTTSRKEFEQYLTDSASSLLAATGEEPSRQADCLNCILYRTGFLDTPFSPCESLTETPFGFERDADIGLEPGMRQGGPDINGDQFVDAIDVEMLTGALDTGEGLEPEMDVNRDGMLDQGDVDFVRGVVEQGKPALSRVDFMFDDEDTGEPLVIEVDGYGFSRDMQVRVGDSVRSPNRLELVEQGLSTAYVFFESLDTAPAQGTEVVVVTAKGSSQALSLDVLVDAIGDQEESTPLDEPLMQQAPDGQALGNADTDCCIKQIKFRGTSSGVRISAYDEGGTPAKNNGPKLTTSGTARLDTDTRTVSIVVVLDGVPVTSFTFNCDNLKTGIYRQPTPDAPSEGATVVEGQKLFEIVSFRTGPCRKPAAPVPSGLTGASVPHDNEDWPKPKPHKGSGALTRLAVPLSSLSDFGCNKACWSQTVSTRIDIWDPDRKKWKKLSSSKPHNDNLDADPKPGGKPWYCYGAETTVNGPNGPELVLGDGPHMAHAGTYWLGGKKIELEKGDVLRRRSVFVSQLICYDPLPEQVLVSLLWSITTHYQHDPDDLSKGGSTKTSNPVIVNAKHVPSKKDRATLKKHLKKKARDLKKCR